MALANKLRLAWLTGLLAVLVCSAGERVLMVRGDGDFPPYEMIENGTLTGANTDIISAAARLAELEVTIQTVPWKRALAMVQGGHADAIIFADRTAERERFLHYDQRNIITDAFSYGFFARSDQAALLPWHGDLQTLRGIRIGVNREYAYPPEFQQAKGLQRIVHDGGSAALLRALQNKRVDMVLAGTQDFGRMAEQAGVAQQITLLQPVFDSRPSYIAFAKAKDTQAVRERFAAAMHKLRQSGEFRAIQQRYGIPAYTK